MVGGYSGEASMITIFSIPLVLSAQDSSIWDLGPQVNMTHSHETVSLYDLRPIRLLIPGQSS